MRNLTALQDRPVEVRGKAPWATRVDAALPRPPFTVLCRTNAGVVGAVVATHEVHRGRVHVAWKSSSTSCGTRPSSRRGKGGRTPTLT